MDEIIGGFFNIASSLILGLITIFILFIFFILVYDVLWIGIGITILVYSLLYMKEIKNFFKKIKK